MQFINTPAGVTRKHQEIVEIKLWEIYLVINRADVSKRLIEASIDNGPVEKDSHEEGRVSFRFYAKDWENIKHLLYEHRIPVVVQSNPFFAVKVRGSQGVLA